MEMLIDVFTDAALDCIKMLPFLFLAFLLIEALEHYSSDFTKKLMIKGTVLKGLCSILIEDLNILLFHSGSYWILLMSCNHSQRKVIPSIMLAVNVSSNTSKKKKLTGEPITLCKSYSYPYLNILKDFTTQEGLTALLGC